MKISKQIDKRIASAFSATCSGIPINMMRISDVYRLGRDAIAHGVDDARLGRQLREYCESIREVTK